jgi:hypothetical protein
LENYSLGGLGMKLRHLLVLFLAFGLIVIFTRDKDTHHTTPSRHAVSRFISQDKILIRYPISSPPERAVADLIWIRHAAKAALKSNHPWFNVLEENITTDFVEGVIKLEKDPVEAEYDAREILGIQAPDDKD